MLRAVSVRKKIGISAVTSHTAGKKYWNGEIKLIQFSVMLFGFRLQWHTYQLPFCKRFCLDWTHNGPFCWSQQGMNRCRTSVLVCAVESSACELSPHGQLQPRPLPHPPTLGFDPTFSLTKHSSRCPLSFHRWSSWLWRLCHLAWSKVIGRLTWDKRVPGHTAPVPFDLC